MNLSGTVVAGRQTVICFKLKDQNNDSLQSYRHDSLHTKT
jgi:hypothetical protein